MKITSISWTKIFLCLTLIIIIFVSTLNYIVDPYSLYKTNFFPNKPKEFEYMRLVKAINVEEIKPHSIVLGTSRAEMAINPEHKYFSKPAYNLSNAGSTVYETKYYLKQAIKQGNLKKVLFVADWRMFNDTMKKVSDFETYFSDRNIYKYLLNYKVLEDSLFTIKNQNNLSLHKLNGQMTDRYVDDVLKAHGSQYKTMLTEEKTYYKNFPNKNLYKDTQRNSFEDLKDILELCYRNNVELDIVFGPSHIRQWEAFDYYQDMETLYKWKKDVVLVVEKIANKQNKKPFRVIDFSIYHDLTAEKVSQGKEDRMKYHFEGSHYSELLGNIVLDRLIDISPYKDFGIELNSQNIDIHIQKLREDRVKFIDTKAYRKEVFGE